MFSSTNNGISLPQLSPCFNFTASLGGFNDDETLLHHDHHDLLSHSSGGFNDDETFLHHDHHDLLSHCLLESPNNKTMSSTKSASISPEVYRSNGDRSRPLPTHRRWQSERKYRHRKIFTAQGPRDRRIRLSIDIARKFFDLQDLLAFDRASKTLDWLLTKSKTAIKELIQMKHIDDPSAKSLCSSECENLDLKKSTASKEKKMRNPAKHKEAKALQMAAFNAVAKELRAKARARARERTKEKNFVRKLNEDKKLPYLNPSIPNQAWSWSQIGSCKTSDSSCHKTISSVNINTGVNGFFCFQPNLIIPIESSSNFSQWSPNTTENWDISSTMTSSSFCALTNVSSSKVLQIGRMPFDFEEHSNNNQD